LLGIRIVDDRRWLLRAPEVLFRAADVALPSFGANVALPALSAALISAVQRNARIRWQPTRRVTAVSPREGEVHVALAEGDTLLAGLVVGADGANSVARAGAGIGKRTWTYPQAAIAGTIVHSRAQDGITTELHRRSGPLTIVPLGDRQSSFVWVEEPGEAERLAHLPDNGFCDELAFRLQGLLGSLRATGRRATFALRGLRAECMGRARVALVGEAAHVIPPIGAQGLNLSLRDAAHLADCVLDSRAADADIGALRTLAAYEEKRRGDVESRTLLVDLLNRSLLSDILPLAAARGVGLHLLANFPLLRRLAIAGGLHSPGQPPRLMHSATLGTGKSNTPDP
jgi:2-octaprenyl-6-methoxyphenol hydroxylase